MEVRSKEDDRLRDGSGEAYHRRVTITRHVCITHHVTRSGLETCRSGLIAEQQAKK